MVSVKLMEQRRYN